MAFLKKHIKQELDKIAMLAESRRLIELQKKLDNDAIAVMINPDNVIVDGPEHLASLLDSNDEITPEQVYRFYNKDK